MARLLTAVLFLLIVANCGDKENPASPSLAHDNVETKKTTQVPVLPTNCPTAEDKANDPTFGKYRSPSCRTDGLWGDLQYILEPSLKVGVPMDVTAFRLYVQHTYPPDQVVRIQKIGGKLQIIAKSALPKEVGKPFTEWKAPQVRTVTLQVWTNWIKVLDDSGYWSLEKYNAKEMAAVADGSNWTLEATQGGIYRRVTREDGTADKSFIQLCKHLLELAQ